MASTPLHPLRARLASILPKPFAVVVVIALCAIPLIYAGALVWANVDPTQNLSAVPAAIVNADAGTEIDHGDDGTERVDLGDELTDTLVHPDADDADTNFGWVEADAADAAAGLADGRYLAVLTIPADFSKTATSAATSDPDDAATVAAGTLEIETDDATNYIAGTLAKSIGTAIADGLGSEVTAELVDALYGGLTDVHDSLADAADGASDLADGAGDAHDGATSLSDGLGTLASSAASLPAATEALDDGVQQALTGATSLRTGVRQLAAGASDLADGADTALTGAQALADGAETLSQRTPTLASGADDVASGLDQLVAAWPVLTDAQKLAALQQLDTGANQVSTGVAQVDAAASALADGADQLVGSSSGDGSGLTALAAGAGTLADGAADAASGATDLRSGLRTIADGTSTLADKAPALVDGIDTAASGSDDLATGTGKVADGADELATSLADGVDDVPSYTDAQATTIADTAADPVVSDAVRTNAVDGYGAGLAPYFLALGLWVGALATYLMRPALSERRLRSRMPAPLAALASFGPNALIAVVQAVAAVLVLHLAVGIQVAQLLPMLGLAALTSLAFMAINQALIALLGAPGRFIGLLMIVLQVASAGGTYPIQTAGPVFEWLHAALPMTYAMAGFRSMIAGGSVDILPLAATLAIWLVAALLVTTAAVVIDRRRGIRTALAAESVPAT